MSEHNPATQRLFSLELGSRQITVNAIAPGLYPSKMTAQLFDNSLDNLRGNSLLKRVGRSEEMAATAIYLCSLEGGYTHGAIIPVDGGSSINHQHARPAGT